MTPTPNPVAKEVIVPDKILIIGGGFAGSGQQLRPGESPVPGQE